MTPMIIKAVEASGGQTKLAEAIGVSQQVVWQWVNGRRPVPPKRCLAIEAATDKVVTRYDLRPDIFGPPPATEQVA